MHQGVVFINFWVVTLCTVMLLLAVLCSIHAAGHCGWSSRLWTLAARIATQWRLSQQNCWQMVSHYASVLCYSVYWDQISVYLATVIILGKYSVCVLQGHAHTHTHLTALCPGLPGWVGARKVKPIWILLKQETVSGSGISWAIRKFAPLFRQITMPASHYSVFLQAGCPSCRPTNSVKALNAVLCAASNTYNKAVIILIDS